jgi:predicted ferric reductase
LLISFMSSLTAAGPIRLTSAVVLGALILVAPVWTLCSSLPVVNTAAAIRLAGQTTGAAGLAWLLLALALSIRIPGFDHVFGGLLRLWRIHHWIGAFGFLALLLHPVLLALAGAAETPHAVLLVLTPPVANWPVWIGWLALLVMMAVMAPTFGFFGQPDYQRWKQVHRLSAIAAALGLLHTFSLLRTLPLPAGYWLWTAFGAMAGGAVLWRLVLSHWLGRRTYVVSQVKPLARGVVELSLTALAGPRLVYRPGQFVYLTPLDPQLSSGRGEEHPYTLSSAPQETDLRIAIKDFGDASGALLHVAEGSRALVEGPYGEFLPERYDQPALWIGGGIGMTPFLAAARAMTHQQDECDVQLVYCVNDASRAYFAAELHAIAAASRGLALHVHHFVEEGPLSERFLREHVPDFAKRRVYVCGPLPLIDLAEALFRRAGVPSSRIICEEFDLL